MSFDPGDYRTPEITYCPNCSDEKAYHFRPRPCAEPGCKVRGCSACLTRCDLGVHDGGFCKAHIGPMETGAGSQWPWKGNVCRPCRAQLAEDLEVIAKECVPPQPVVAAMEEMEVEL